MKWERIVEVSGEQRGSLREITYSTQEAEDIPRQALPQGNAQPPRPARAGRAVRWVELNVSVGGAVRTVYLEEEDAVQAVAMAANFLQRQEQPDREARAECCTGAAREIGCVEFDEGLVRDVCVVAESTCGTENAVLPCNYPESGWVPAASTVCRGRAFLQTNAVPGCVPVVRLAHGTKLCPPLPPSIAPGQKIEVILGNDISRTIRLLYTFENRPVSSWSATGLPLGMEVEEGNIIGTADEVGSFSTEVTATGAGGVGRGVVSIIVYAVSWDDLDKPATFPPTAHTHPIGDVGGLQALLESKLAFSAPRLSPSDPRLNNARVPLPHGHGLQDFVVGEAVSGQWPIWNGNAWVAGGYLSGMGVESVQVLTQAQYAAAVKSATTLYFVI